MRPGQGSAGKIGNLRIRLQDQPDRFATVPVSPPSIMFDVVAYCICLALDMLESEDELNTLRATGQTILDSVRRGVWKNGPLKLKSANLPRSTVDEFLATIRADFPNLVVSDRVPGEAYTIRKQWYSEGAPAYRPKEAGVIFLDKWVCSTPALLLAILPARTQRCLLYQCSD